MGIEEIDKDFEALDYLGFLERKIYKIDSKLTQSTDEILKGILDLDIFFETQKGIDYNNAKPRKYFIRTNHAFTDKIEIDDFEKLNYEQLKKRIKEIEQEPDWGADLPLFRTLIAKSKTWIEENKYQSEEFYFIYSKSLPNEKLIQDNYYSYFMSMIIILISELKIVIINHGGD